LFLLTNVSKLQFFLHSHQAYEFLIQTFHFYTFVGELSEIIWFGVPTVISSSFLFVLVVKSKFPAPEHFGRTAAIGVASPTTQPHWFE